MLCFSGKSLPFGIILRFLSKPIRRALFSSFELLMAIFFGSGGLAIGCGVTWKALDLFVSSRACLATGSSLIGSRSEFVLRTSGRAASRGDMVSVIPLISAGSFIASDKETAAEEEVGICKDWKNSHSSKWSSPLFSDSNELSAWGAGMKKVDRS